MNRIDSFISRHDKESIERKMQEWKTDCLLELCINIFHTLTQEEIEYIIKLKKTIIVNQKQFNYIY